MEICILEIYVHNWIQILNYSLYSTGLFLHYYQPVFEICKKNEQAQRYFFTGLGEDRARYLDIEQMVKRELRDAERFYVNGILQNGLESGNNKPF